MWNEDKDAKQMHIILFIRTVVTSQQKILPSSYKRESVNKKSSTHTM